MEERTRSTVPGTAGCCTATHGNNGSSMIRPDFGWSTTTSDPGSSSSFVPLDWREGLLNVAFSTLPAGAPPDFDQQQPTLPNGTADPGGTMDFFSILPLWRLIVWNVLFAGIVITATVGNLIVVWIVLSHKRMRTVTNYFLVNLSIADAMVSTLNVTFNYTYMLYLDWPFGTLYCKISQFVAILSICASVFTLMAIAIDRYVAIMNPLKPRMGRKATLCIAAGIWIVGTIISSPMLLFFTTYNLNDHILCYAEWPDGASNHSAQEYAYNIVFMVLTYFLPIGSMTYTYARVGLELWGSKSIGECTQRQLENIKSKRRVVKMMMIVVIIFAVCWLPFHFYFIITSYYPELTKKPYIQEVYLAIYWLAMSNSMYNPIIYCWMNSRFRRGFQQFFRCCPFVHVMPDSQTSHRRIGTSRYSCSGSPDHLRIVRNDTERSFLYNGTTNSPSSQRKWQGGHMRRANTLPVNHQTTSMCSVPVVLATAKD
ncbi:tachykinin-like peptides receptor 99D isoform X1 [Anopheles aquasalis]|uniref:tachykinin-like peptides receptor 99D isoform X1 n=1 Tax=Anopheles aquasalis TaxID=42839 RepID=UPI00215B12D1|nr:tachykinin-like peptides receptor 99D isoform X1 [Anopheles aquasalis]